MTLHSNLVVDVAPLWELEYTGISNVVYELAERFLNWHSPSFNVRFTTFNNFIDTKVIERCVLERCGTALREAFDNGRDIEAIVESDTLFRNNIGLFLHVKSAKKRFSREASLYYDLSFLSVPECHTADTIRFHTHDLEKQVLSTDLFFCISQSTADDLHWFFDVDPANIRIALLGPNADPVRGLARKVALQGQLIEPYALTLGTLEPRKNIRLVLRWLQEHTAVLDRMRFVFVGREGWGSSFDALIKEYSLDRYAELGRLVHLGYITEPQKEALIAGATLMIYPSLFEGFGLPVLEAMAMEVPVIASCSTSIPEVMGPDGLYFDPFSVESFDQCFRQFIGEYYNGMNSQRTRRLKRRSAAFSYDRTFDVIVNGIKQAFLQPLRKAKEPRS